MVISYYYTRNQYEIDYNINGVAGTDSYYYDAPVAARPFTEKTGYTFTGWSTEWPAAMPA